MFVLCVSKERRLKDEKANKQGKLNTYEKNRRVNEIRLIE
jgi:hypothetical protein